MTDTSTHSDGLTALLRTSWDSEISIMSQTSEWMRQRRKAADMIDALAAERDALRAENERLRGLFRRISWVLSPERSETEAVAYNFARAALEGVNPTPPQQGDDA